MEESIKLEIEELSLAEELSSTIQEDYKCISVKINYTKDEYDADLVTPPDEFHSVKAYFNDCKLDIVYSTLGLHLQGENKKPHVHYHLIVRSLPSGTFQSANPMHRKRWQSKEGNEMYTFENVSIRFPKKEDPVWQQLAYPFKEGRPIMVGCKNITKYYNFLMEYATNLYQVSLGNRARQEACDERKKTNLLSLAKLCQDHKSEFTTFKEMMIWLDTSYIAMLDLEDYPDPRNYKTNCQKICVHLGKLKYSDMI